MFECVTGTEDELVQGKHDTEAQDQSAAEQLEKLDIADSEAVGTEAQQGANQQGVDQHGSGAQDREDNQHSVSALMSMYHCAVTTDMLTALMLRSCCGSLSDWKCSL